MILPLRAVVVSLSLGLAAAGSHAATPRSWSQHDRAVGDACLAASTLQRPKISGAPVLFEDSVGYTALLITGRYPQPRKKHLSGRELCLFHRASGTVHLTDAERLGSGRQ